jgi:hypothetical protein
MKTAVLLAERIGDPLLGIILPLAILAISFWVAWALFRKFSKH